jgi:hypothetical protein
VAWHPDNVVIRVGRALLLARQGQVALARDEARACLDSPVARDRDRRPPILYQAANVYALTSPLVPGDDARALGLLAQALQGGFGLDVVEKDPDFAPLRKNPAFGHAVVSARYLAALGRRAP